MNRNWKNLRTPIEKRWQHYRRKNPGIMHQLSPFSLYAKPPPRETPATNGGSGNGAGGNGSGGTGGFRTSNGGGINGGNNNSGSNENNGMFKNGKNFNKNNNNNNNNNDDLNFDNFEYPDSPTQKWLADNADLSPLTVLDNINLKTEFPYSAGNPEIDKPPDINSITLDSQAENLLQFAATVPVPDNSATFLDIGGDSFSQSLYDDLGDITLTDFGHHNNNNNHAPNHNHSYPSCNPGQQSLAPEINNISLIAAAAAASAAANAVAGNSNIPNVQLPNKPLLIPKPITLEKLSNNSANSVISPPSIKNIVEPLPASALKGLIKQEANASLPPPPAYSSPPMIKVIDPHGRAIVKQIVDPLGR